MSHVDDTPGAPTFDDFLKRLMDREAASSSHTTANPPAAPATVPTGSTPELAVPPVQRVHRPTHAVSTANDDDALPPWRAVALETEILRVLSSPRNPGETIEGEHTRREAELLATCDQLSIEDTRVLLDRLRMPKPDDPIVVGVSRLVERRQRRLMEFLADARRRDAIRAARRSR